jgi:hypothetical protein
MLNQLVNKVWMLGIFRIKSNFFLFLPFVLLQVMLINVVAMDMLKSKIPPGKRAGLFMQPIV